MVRFYILPNADYLQENEIDFEIRFREVEIGRDAKLEDRKRALRYAYKNERREPKLYSTGLSITDEIKTLDGTLNSLRQALRREFDYTIVSRLRYYLIRLSSSVTINEEEERLKEEQCKQIEQFLRAFRQRVTYDPELSNDETDLDYNEGAKALKQSWRNPDPKAIALMGQKSRTGTVHKDKTQNRGVESELEKPKDKRDERRVNKDRSKQQREMREVQDEKNGRQNKYEKYASNRTKYRRDNYRSSTQYSSTASSDTEEGEYKERDQDRYKKKSSEKSRGRFYSTSLSESSSELEEERRRHRERYNYRSPSPARRNRGRREDYHRSIHSRVEKWDIVFSGDARSIQVEDFLNRVKKLAKHEGVGKNELLNKIHYRLKGEASDWWFTRESHCTTWEKFDSEIRFRFGNPNRDRGIRSQLRELRQKRGETFVAFVTEVEKLNQCLKRPHSSRSIFEIVWENMRPHYRSKLATTRVHNLEHLLELNHRIDANDPGLYRTGYNTRGEIHSMDAQKHSDSDYSSVEDYTVNAFQRKLKISQDTQKMPSNNKTLNTPTEEPMGIKCWNCLKTGHHWKSCTSTKLIFCYACGNMGRTTRTCERNHPQLAPNTHNALNGQNRSLN